MGFLLHKSINSDYVCVEAKSRIRFVSKSVFPGPVPGKRRSRSNECGLKLQ